ncbi:MAG: cysteine desulfurase [Bacilli bacterium]|nr:cysteine desulfurase [Bacilli bacterium]
MIYLDYAANCPVDKEVLEDFNLNSILYFANPNSSHKLGLEAKEKIDETTKYIAKIFNCSVENVIYTSGSTESNNLAIKGFAEFNKDCHIITTGIEHSSITAPCNYLLSKGYNVDILEVNSEGQIDISNLVKLIDDKKTLVSITSVESETGIIENIEEIGRVLSKYDNVVFHTDATGSIGKVNINFENVDMITFSPHKFYGINGVGVLIKKGNVKLLPLIHGGKSTSKYRSGTPALALILSIRKALELAINNIDKNTKYIKELNEYLKSKLSKYSNVYFNSTENSIYNTLNISILGVDSKEFSKELENYDIYISTKSACSSDKNISKTIYAITKDEERAKSTLRISLSHLTTKEELDEFLRVFDIVYKKMVG